MPNFLFVFLWHHPTEEGKGNLLGWEWKSKLQYGLHWIAGAWSASLLKGGNKIPSSN